MDLKSGFLLVLVLQCMILETVSGTSCERFIQKIRKLISSQCVESMCPVQANEKQPVLQLQRSHPHARLQNFLTRWILKEWFVQTIKSTLQPAKCVLWPDDSRWWLDRSFSPNGWLPWFCSELAWLQAWLWSFGRWILDRQWKYLWFDQTWNGSKEIPTFDQHEDQWKALCSCLRTLRFVRSWKRSDEISIEHHWCNRQCDESWNFRKLSQYNEILKLSILTMTNMDLRVL